MIGSIQHGSVVEIISTPTPNVALMLGSAISSTLINRGTSSVIDDANVTRESVCLFYPWGTWANSAVQNLFMTCFTTCKYPFI